MQADSESDISHSIKPLILSTIAGMLGMCWFAIAFGVPTTMLFESLSGSGVIVGLFTTLTQLASICMLPSVILSEFFSSRKLYWGIVSLSNRLLWFSPVIVIYLFSDKPHSGALILIFLLGLAACFGHSAGPIWMDWMADLVPEKISEKYWGIRQSVTSVVFFFATALSGYILDIFPAPGKEGGSYKGFIIVFTIGASLGVLDILLHLIVPDKHHVNTGKPSAPVILNKIISPFKDNDFRYMTLAYAAWFFAMFIIGPFGFIYLKREFGTSYSELSVISAVASLSAVIFGILNGMIIDRISARTYFCIALVIAPLLWFAWFFAPDGIYEINLIFTSFKVRKVVAIITVAYFIAGIFASGAGICQVHLVNYRTDKKWRRVAIAEHWGLVGIVSAIAPFAGGAITDLMSGKSTGIMLPSGKEFSFIHAQVIIAGIISWALAIPLMLKVKPDKEGMSIGRTVLLIYLYPLRGIGTLYNVIGSIILQTKNNGRRK